MNPADLSLPAKFTEFRELQLDTALAMSASEKRFQILSAPTGAGKSIIYMTAAQLLQARTVVVTSNKGLQEQLMRDFGAVGLVDIRGQGNYPCVALTAKSKSKTFHGCDDGPCHHGAFCELHPRYAVDGRYRPGCHFYDALARARKSRLVITNNDFWMSANRYMDPGVLGPFDLLIVDEAHDAPEKLADFCTVRMSEDECREFLDSPLPPVEDGPEAWVAWVDAQRTKLADLEEELKFGGEQEPGYAKQLRNFIGRVRFLGTAKNWERAEATDPAVQLPGVIPDWVGERTGDMAVFSPIWAHRYAERFLYVGVPRVFMVSATIMRQTAAYAGIPDDRMAFNENVNAFPILRRPVYFMPTASIGRNSTESDYRAVTIRIDQILGRRRDRKGIILCPSFDLSYRLRMASQYRNSMRFNKRGDNIEHEVNKFKASSPGTTFISPSIAQGYDFPYADAEFVIIPKVPFADTRSLVMQARVRSDKQYQNYVAALKLVQQCGRAMRAKDDQCEIFILDTNFGWFLRAAKAMLPAWFRKAIVTTGMNPEPPVALERAFSRDHPPLPWLGRAY